MTLSHNFKVRVKKDLNYSDMGWSYLCTDYHICTIYYLCTNLCKDGILYIHEIIPVISKMEPKFYHTEFKIFAYLMLIWLFWIDCGWCFRWWCRSWWLLNILIENDSKKWKIYRHNWQWCELVDPLSAWPYIQPFGSRWSYLKLTRTIWTQSMKSQVSACLSCLGSQFRKCRLVQDCKNHQIHQLIRPSKASPNHCKRLCNFELKHKPSQDSWA